MTWPWEQPTEEQKAEMMEEEKRQELLLEEFRHSSQRMFEELGEDELRTLKTMLGYLARERHPYLASAWEGMAAMALKIRFGVCITCGTNHDAEFEHDFDKSKEEKADDNSCPTPLGKVCMDSTCPIHFGKRPAVVVSSEDVPLEIFDELTAKDRANMEKYHLDDLRIEGTNELIGFLCTGIYGSHGPCGMRYQSIEDRMLRDPEECSGCFRKMAQG